MRRQTRLALLWILLLAGPGCSTAGREPPEPEVTGIEITAVVIRNELAFTVTDVQILVPATGAFMGCGNVMAGTACSTRFPMREFRAWPVVVSWKEYGKQHDTGEFVIEIPQHIVPGLPTRLEVVIFAMGQAGAKLVQ
jgi:hypothetical protein